MLAPQVPKYISNLSDTDLLAYLLAGQEAYEKEAIDFARAELASRKITDEEKETCVSEVWAKWQKSEQTALTPLGLGGRSLAFTAGAIIFPILLPLMLLLIARAAFRARGEHQKLKDMWRCAAWGFFTVFTIVAFVQWWASRTN